MKELTTEEKAQILIEAGLFSEDFVLANKDFIEGAYVVYSAQGTINRNVENLLNAAMNYGMAETKQERELFNECFNSIDSQYRRMFFYTLSKIAEKSGHEALLID